MSSFANENCVETLQVYSRQTTARSKIICVPAGRSDPQISGSIPETHAPYRQSSHPTGCFQRISTSSPVTESPGPTPSRSHSTGGSKGHRQTVSWEGQTFSGAEGKNHSTSPQSQRGPVRLVTVVLCCIYLTRPEVSSLFYLMICIVIVFLYLIIFKNITTSKLSCWKNILCHKKFYNF